MMKTILLSTALMISGVAYAQADPRDAGQPVGSGNVMQPGSSMGDRDSLPQGTTTGTTTTTTTDMSTGSTMSTDTTATTGATTMGTTGSGTVMVQQGGNMTAPPTPRDSYPRCSRTITDNCVQDESRASDRRGGPPARRRR
ncbi:hypothetical protein [Sphingomonas sp.]|jgi:hypothetical protein|uniref:hypothetical protein n=1 Tax=Sphingomonas sp. TaxID=28214 RepID=UPI002DE277C9|nr:hypothetical protein [Sphingomonas sp.]